jgi:hypothetical protein
MWDRESQNPTVHFSDPGPVQYASRLHGLAVTAFTIHSREFNREKHSPRVMITQSHFPPPAGLFSSFSNFDFMPSCSGNCGGFSGGVGSSVEQNESPAPGGQPLPGSACLHRARRYSDSCSSAYTNEMQGRSGKGTASPPLPPLRTGHESFPSSGSSRCKAPRERSRFSRRFNPGFVAMDSELFEERTFFKIVLPV